MQDITRRNFVGAAAAVAGAAAVSSVALADEPAAKPEGLGSYAEGAPADLEWQGTPAELFALGTSTMPLDELNRRRQAYLDAQTDFTAEDGTVIPAWAVKVRCLIHSYGMGCGNTAVASTYDDILATFDEDTAQAYIESPMGVAFTALDFSEKTGRTMEECAELAEYFADHGYVCREETNEGVKYHHVPFFQGVVEYHMREVLADPLNYNLGVQGTDMLPDDMRTTGTPTFYAIPCDKSVVADEAGVQPYDDIEKLVAEQTLFGIAPCYCRYTAIAKVMEADGKVAGVDYPSLEDFASGEYGDYFSPLCDQRVETCLMIGEEADYWIHLGIARQISKEEALEFMQRSRDDGFILEKNFSKHMGTICSCHMDSCGIIAEWMSLGSAEAIGASQPFTQISHYDLVVDTDACLKCGTCAERCPLHAITMDGEDGLPVVNDMCFRCGQCAWACPVEARKQVARDEALNAPLPHDFLDDDNVKAAYRFEAGLIK